MNTEKSFGNLVRERRRLLDLTQEELARRVGCAAVTLRKIEADDLRPSQQIAERLAMSLGIPLDDRAVFVRLARSQHPDRAAPTPLTPTPTPEEIGGEDLSGRAIRGYALGERIGTGGFGAVYRAVQPVVEREVAIKIILPQYANRPEFIRRFEAEAQLVARLEHPHIVPLYDYWREPGVAYLVMRLLRGGSIHTLLQGGGPLPLETVARILEQVGSALGAAHRAGIIHRDLKPANILLDEYGNAYLADFGIAKNLGNPNLEDQTRADEIIGSPSYFSPEQIRSETVRPQADIYSLGVVLYELLTGAKPFQGPTPIDLIQQHLTVPLPPLSAHRSGLPAILDVVIARATAKNPLDRYSDVENLVVDFRRVVAEGPLTVLGAPVGTAEAELPEPENPYKGLRAFGEADTLDFYGREALTQQLLARMAEGGDLSRFLAVVGPSGSGKSSVVKAGLMPALRRGGLPGSENWFIVDLIPGPHPFEELEAALLRITTNPPVGALHVTPILTQLREDKRGLLRAVRRCLPDDPGVELVLVIDQFEEIFTLIQDEATRTLLLDSLVTAALDERSRVRIVITLRADFTDRPLNYVDFGELLRQRMEVVLPLTPDELEFAISGPAGRVGLKLEPGLETAILRDVSDQPGALPLLQYALTELFAKREARNLTQRAYIEIGGVLGALGRRAEEVFISLDKTSQEAARQVFLRLVTLGEGTEDTRRRVLRSELENLAAGRELSAILEFFGKARLLTFDRDPQTRAPTVDVAHEALLREWKRLCEWIQSSRADMRMQRQLASAAADWSLAEREPSFLLSGARLAHFDGWAAINSIALTQDERAFLMASIANRQQQQADDFARQQRELEAAQKLAETEKRRAEEQTLAAGQLRKRGAFLTVASIIAILLAVAAVLFGQRAYQNQKLATSRELAAAAINNLQVDPERSVLLALQALEEVDTLEARNALHQAIQDLHILLSLSDTSAYSQDGTLFSLIDADHSVQVVDAHSQQTLFTTPSNALNPAINTFISPDGKRLFIAHTDGTLEVLDANTGQALLTIPTGLDFAGYFVTTFSPDGKYLGICSLTVTVKTIDVWDLSTGKKVFTRTNPEGEAFTIFNPLGNITISPDGTHLATANFGGVPKVWDIATGQELFTLTGHTSSAIDIAYSPDGKRLVTSSDDSTARVWDAATGRELLTLSGHTARLQYAVFSPDGTQIATASDDNLAKIWDSSTGKELFTLAGHNGGVPSVAFSPDGKILATGGDDGQTKLWEVASGQELLNLTGHTGSVYIGGFSQDGMRLFTFGLDGTMKVWDLSPGREALTLLKTGYFAAYSPDGTTLASGGDGQLKIWNATSGEELFSLPIKSIIMRVAFSPDGKFLAVASQGGIAEVWDLVAKQKLFTITVADPEHWVTNIAYSPDGKRLATACTDGFAKVWDAATGQELRTLPAHTEEVWGIAFNPNGTRLAAGGRNGIVKVWDLATGQELLNLPGDSDVFPVAFSPDGKTLAIGNAEGLIKLWEAETGKGLPSLSGHTGIAYDLAFSSDGKQLASASWDGTVKVWEVATGLEFITLTGHTGRIAGLTLSPDGTRLASTAWDETVRVYLLRTEDLVALARSRVTRTLTSEECRKFLHRENCP